jgi:hypothetical protein
MWLRDGGRLKNGLPDCATGVIAYLENGSIIYAPSIAAHESPRTTKLYDRTIDTLTLDEI